MTPEQLKKSLLQEAITGKLVPQDPAEGTGEALYQQIQQEKEEQRKKKEKETGKKIRKEKPLPPITAEEIPFEIPKNWKWVRLGEIVFNHGQKKPENEFSYIDINSIDNTIQKLKPIENLIKPEEAPSRARKIIANNDILYATVRPYLHNVCIVDKVFSAEPIASTGFAVLTCFEGVYIKYLFYYLLSPTFDSYANDNNNSRGVAYPAISDKKLFNGIVALPPLAEQKRIAAKLDELQPLVKEYAAAYDKLTAYAAKFPEDLKKSILQEAIMGKLVPQDPAEGTGEALYQQIQQEKEEQRKKKEKGKKIRKEKPLPPITAEEIPFAIPANWKWVRLGEIVAKEIKRGKSPTYAIKSDVLVFAQKCNTKANTIDLSLAKYLDKDKFTTYPESEYLQNQDILINSTGTGTLGRVGIFHDVDNPLHYTVVPDSHVTTVRIGSHMSALYLYYILKASQKQFEKLGEGSTKQKELKAISLKNYLIPLPPLAEQKRIVAKIEEIWPLVDKLKKA